MNKEDIFKIIDNKIESFNLSDYVEKYGYRYFDSLINAIKLNKSITTLNLSLNLSRGSFSYTNRMKNEVKNLITKISTFINNKTNITTLILSNCYITLEDLELLFIALQNNTSIKTLDLSNNKISFFLDKKYYSMYRRIIELQLCYNNMIKTYKLEGAYKTNINQTLELLKDQLNPLKQLFIDNSIFLNMLLNNKTITTLNLSNKYNKSFYCPNEINIISEIFQQNKTIKNLDFSDRLYSFDNILNFIKNNNCIENLTVSLYKDDYNEDKLKIIKEYFYNNTYLKKLILISEKNNSITLNK